MRKTLILYCINLFRYCPDPDYCRTDKGNYKYKLEDILLLVILDRLAAQFGRNILKDEIKWSQEWIRRS